MKDIGDQELRDAVKLKCKNDNGINLTEEQIDLCITTMEIEKVSLFHGHLYANQRQIKVAGDWSTRITWDKTIDGYRAQAHRYGLAGIDEPDFVYDKEGKPLMCKVTVHRRVGHNRDAYVGVARYDEFVTLQWAYEDGKKLDKKVPQRQWLESPCNQLSIAAEKQALRKGFQELMGGEDEVAVEDHVDVPVPEPEIPQPRAYESGAIYADGSKIIDMYGSKSSEETVLELDSGFKVKLDKEGNEIARKKLEQPAEKEEPPPGNSAHEGQRGTNTDPLAMIRIEIKPLLRRWCEERNDGVKISPKQIYEKLEGVVIAGGTKMGLDDYQILKGSLEDQLKKAS